VSVSNESFVGKPIQTSRGAVFVNPGTGPVQGATEENSLKNIEVFVADLGLNPGDISIERMPSEDKNGRYRYLLS